MMKRTFESALFATAVVLICAFNPLWAETPSRAEDENAISAIKDKWRKAYLTSDVNYMASIMSPNYIQTNARGQVSNRAEELKELGQGEIQYTRFESVESKVNVYGDAAIATGETWIQATLKKTGKAIDVHVKVTDTFIRQNGKWMLVASAATTVPSPSPAP